MIFLKQNYTSLKYMHRNSDVLIEIGLRY